MSPSKCSGRNAEFVEQNKIKTRSFENKLNLIKYSLDLAENIGLIWSI
ncbi:hypothetical protein [Methanobacterium oryzae]